MSDNDATLVEQTVAAALGLVPSLGVLTPAAERLLVKVRQERARRVSHALRTAERVTGLTREELTDRIEADPRLVPLYVRILYAAGMNGADDTLAAMGATLGVAVGDEDRLEDAEIIMAALQDLGDHHFVVLRALTVPPATDGQGNAMESWYTSPSIAERAGLYESRTRTCLVNLAGAGLASIESGFGALVYGVTDLGQAVLQAAETLDES